MFKSIIIILSIITIGNSDIGMKKRFIPYEIIIGCSDLIVEGQISKVNGKSYEFEITDKIKSESENGKRITVNLFPEWTCDARITPAKKDQNLLLFLTKNKNGTYEIINGSSGELFIENIETEFYYDFKFKDYKDIKVGMRMFIKSYEHIGVLYPKRDEKSKFKQIVCDLRIEEMKRKSVFFKSIVENINRKYQIEK